MLPLSLNVEKICWTSYPSIPPGTAASRSSCDTAAGAHRSSAENTSLVYFWLSCTEQIKPGRKSDAETTRRARSIFKRKKKNKTTHGRRKIKKNLSKSTKLGRQMPKRSWWGYKAVRRTEQNHVAGGTQRISPWWNQGVVRCPEFLFWSKIFVTRPCKILWFRKALFQPSCLCSVVTHWRRRLTSVCPCSCSWRSRRSTWCRLFRGCGAPRPSWSAFCKYGSSQVYCVPGTERENITSRTTES